jgi:nitrile hydratase subunit alpha
LDTKGLKKTMPHDHENHLSSSGHPYRKDQDKPLTYWQNMEIAVREILIQKRITSNSEVHQTINDMDNRSPANGAKVVARAWTDQEYKKRLLNDASEASRELGFDIGALKLIALENTEEIHNVVVCTLCSCYPRNLLGLPPDWYKQRSYRSRIVKFPRKVLKEFGLQLSKDISIRVHDSTADMRYIVLPLRPKATESFSVVELEALVTRDSMIGVGLPKPI